MKKTILLSGIALLLSLSNLQAKDVASLRVNVEPSDARIRILNIKPKFYNGIQLQKDKKYHLYIDKKGYSSINKWVALNTDKELNFTLDKNKNAKKRRKLGDKYLLGKRGVKQNTSMAISLYKQACNNGDALACNNLGDIYFQDIDGNKNISMAVKKYKDACRGGYIQACSNLGVIYDKGIGVDRNISMAVTLYKNACKSHHAISCYNLGVLYEAGRGVTKNYSIAIKRYKYACAYGVSSGCLNLGVMYYQGKGVHKNFPMAAKYFKKACNAGNFAGCQNLNRM